MNFLDSTSTLDQAIPGSYNEALVLLSVSIACLGSYSCLSVPDRIHSSKIATHRLGWLAAGALAMGSGVWAMHFVGMLAFVLPFAVGYDILTTVISMIPAIFAAAVMLYVISRPNIKRSQILIGGILMGIGIGAMHHIGMMAMQMNATMQYDPLMFTASIVIACALAVCAVMVRPYIGKQDIVSNAVWRDVSAAAVMGFAASAMHYTAMAATYFFPNTGEQIDIVAFDPKYLGILIASVAAVIITVLFAATAIGRQMEAYAKESEARARLTDILRIAPEAVISAGEDMKIQLFNRSAEKIFGYSAEEVLGKSIETLIPEAYRKRHGALVAKFTDSYQSNQSMDSRQGVFGLRKDNVEFPATASVSQIEIDGGKVYTVMLRDITEKWKMQQEIEKLAHHDSLTGLPNRNFFDDRLHQEIANAKRINGEIRFVYLDLDGFKQINDSLGHKAGDLVLQETALRLTNCVRATDTVARMGGDEFAIILAVPITAEDSRKIAERILAALSEPIVVNGQTCIVGASVGISTYPVDTDDPETLIKFSDEAMYKVKASGRNGIRFYSG